MSNCASFGVLATCVVQTAAEDIDVTLVAGGSDIAGDWCAVHARRAARCLSSLGFAQASTTKGISAIGSSCAKCIAVPRAQHRHHREVLCADGTEPLRLHRLGVDARHLQQLLSLLPGDVLAQWRG